MAADSPRARQLLSVLGIVPLGAYVVSHVWETSSAPAGSRAFATSVSGLSGDTVVVVFETVFVLVPLVAHAALGALLTVRERPPAAGGYPSGAARTVARATGAGLAAFLVIHVVQTWGQKLSGLDGVGLYQTLRDQAGQPLVIVVYVLGITCVAFHLALGIGALPETWPIARTDAGRRYLRVLGAAVGVLVWVISMNTLSHFAVGRAIAGAAEPADAASSPEVAP